MNATLTAFFSALLVFATPAIAQPQLVPPVVRLIVPFTAGGSTDVLARTVAAQLGPRLGTTVVVENRAGAGGLIGAASVAKGPRDGSLLLLATGSLVTSVATARGTSFDMNTDLVPVSLLGEGPMVVAVSTATDIRTPADLVAAARAKPDQLTYGTAGVGTIGHLTAELINDAAKIQTRHVPYKGTSAALVDLASGTIDMTVAIYTTIAPQIKAGRVRIIGVTSQQGNAAMPGIPPMALAVPGLDATTWNAVFAPAGTPPALLQRLNRELNEISRQREVGDQFSADGVTPRAMTLEELQPYMRQSLERWKHIATTKKILAE